MNIKFFGLVVLLLWANQTSPTYNNPSADPGYRSTWDERRALERSARNIGVGRVSEPSRGKVEYEYRVRETERVQA